MSLARIKKTTVCLIGGPLASNQSSDLAFGQSCPVFFPLRVFFPPRGPSRRGEPTDRDENFSVRLLLLFGLSPYFALNPCFYRERRRPLPSFPLLSSPSAPHPHPDSCRGLHRLLITFPPNINSSKINLSLLPLFSPNSNDDQMLVKSSSRQI